MLPMLRGRQLSAKQYRLYFWFFTIRHALGIGLFAWILAASREVGNYFWLIAAALAVYLATAVYNGIKIWGLYQRRSAEEAGLAAGVPLEDGATSNEGSARPSETP